MEKKLIKLAYIGSGGWARKNHFPALKYIVSAQNEQYEVHLQGITSLDYQEACEVAGKYGFARVYKNIDDLISDSEINAVAVAITPDALKDVLTQVVTRNIPILSEKPPGISSKQAQFLSETVRVPNLVTFNRRFNPLNQIFRKIVQEMTDIHFVEGSFYRHARLDETFMIGTGIHWINFIEYVLGPIAEVQTQRWKNPQNNSWLRTANIVFKNGIKGFVKFFPCSGSVYERLEVHSNAQSVYLDGPLAAYPGKIVIDAGNHQQVIEQPEPIPPEIVRLGIVGEYQAFFELMTMGTPSPSTFQNAVSSMRVAEAMENNVDMHF